MLVDLHMHTYFSDGTMSPEELVDKAKELGLGLIAVADHNTIDAYHRAKVACDESNIEILTAVEIDTMLHGKKFHLLAYDFEINNKELIQIINDCDAKIKHGIDMIMRNMAVDFDEINLTEYENYTYDLRRGGHKYSNYLIDKGIISSYTEGRPLFKSYKLPVTELGLPQMKEVCRAVKIAGGYSILAHPGCKLNKDRVLIDLKEALKAGIDGVECFYPEHTEEITNLCVNFSNQHGLLVTSGCDEHGDWGIYHIGTMKIDSAKLRLKRIGKVVTD